MSALDEIRKHNILETADLVAFHNSSDEIFVRHKISGVTVRIGSNGSKLQITAAGYSMEHAPLNSIILIR